MLMTGTRGELRSGYARAARLSTWSMTRRDVLGSYYTVVAKVDRADAFWSVQPLDSMWLLMGKDAWWVWYNVRVEGAISVGASVEINCEGSPNIRLNHQEEEAWDATDSRRRK